MLQILSYYSSLMKDFYDLIDDDIDLLHHQPKTFSFNYLSDNNTDCVFFSAPLLG